MSITFPDAIQFKKHNFQSVSGPQEYMVEVPYHESSPTAITVENTPQGVRCELESLRGGF